MIVLSAIGAAKSRGYTKAPVEMEGNESLHGLIPFAASDSWKGN
jgi:hypothetical protein